MLGVSVVDLADRALDHESMDIRRRPGISAKVELSES